MPHRGKEKEIDSESGPSASLLSAMPVPGFSNTQQLQPIFLLLSFSDQAFSTTTAASYPSFLFTGSPGFADYYRVASGGKLSLDNTAAGSVILVDMPQSYSSYVSGQSGLGGYPQNNRGMVEDALDTAYSDGLDFSLYDNDGPDGVPGSIDDDGAVDALVVVHSGPAAEYFTQPEASFHMASHYDSFPEGQEWFADSVKVIDWAMVPERDPDVSDGDGSHSRGTAGNYEETLGTLVHEFAHVLGLPDLYDPPLGDGTLLSLGLGHYDLMSYGLYGMKTHDDIFTAAKSSWGYPGLPSAWSRSYLGWVEPVAVHADTAFQIWRAQDPAPLDYPQVVKIWSSSSWSALTPWSPSEYFLIEHRQNDGAFTYDGGFNYDNEGAALLYHIDENVILPGGTLANYPNDDPTHKGVDLEEADSNTDLDDTTNFGDFLNYPVGGIQGDFYRQGQDDFWMFSGPDPNNRNYSGQDTGVNIVNGFGPLSDADLADYLVTVDLVTHSSSTIGYSGTTRAGPFVIIGGTFDDGDSDAWITAGQDVRLKLDIKHAGMPNTARNVRATVDSPDFASISVTSVSYGDLPALAKSAGDGEFVFTMVQPASAFSWFSVTVQMIDDNLNFSEETLSLPVVPNNAPQAFADSYTTDENVPLIVAAPGVLTNDGDVEGDTLTAVPGLSPSHGSLALSTDGSFTYTPDNGYDGPDSFSYSAFDGYSYSGTVTVSLKVQPSNSGGGGGPCFVATALWGSEHWKTDRLRAFRDTYLMPNVAGKQLVKSYYRYSPVPADWVKRHPAIQKGLSTFFSVLLWPFFL